VAGAVSVLRGLQRTAGELQTMEFHFQIGKKKTKPQKKKWVELIGIKAEKISKAAKGNPAFCISYNAERVRASASESELVNTLKKT